MIATLLYKDGDSHLVPLESLLEMPPDAIPENHLLWVDMFQPTEEEEAQILRDWFPVSDLELSDIHRAKRSHKSGEQHFPKAEEFETHLAIIVRGSILPDRESGETLERYLPRISGGQINVFMNHRVLITHRYDEMHVVERVQRMLSTNSRFAARGPDFAMAQILDATVNDALQIASLVEERLTQLEEVIMDSSDSEMASRLMRHRRRIFLLRRVIGYQQNMCARLASGGSDFVNHDESLYYSDVLDHHTRAADQLDLLRVLVDGLMDLYFSMTSHRLNQVMRVLTVISTVFLPITFITSWYGMNFEHMPELAWQGSYLAVALLVVTVSLGMLFHARRRGWLG
jgi:magnesium transporter